MHPLLLVVTAGSLIPQTNVHPLAMFSIIPFQFRFRGKVRRILDIYFCFLDEGNIALHPTQIARKTGISFAEVARRLDATPELFVKLPRRPDGITRYRVTTSASARSPEENQALITKYAQRESWLYYAFVAMVVATLVILVLLIVPNV